MTHIDTARLRLITGRQTAYRLAMFIVTLGLGGCASLTNPVANGIPVRYIPPELLGESREVYEPIPLFYLQQTPSDHYELGGGDVLSVYIEGVLGNRDTPPPVSYPELSELSPAVGYPIPIRDNGTAPLPLIAPVKVEGLTIEQAEQAIIDAYTATNPPVLQPGRERILVTLVRRRQTRILVMREDSPTGGLNIRTGGIIRNTSAISGGAAFVGGARQATGTIVDLPAYQNDILHALAQSGGLPGLYAANEVIIYRGGFDASTEGDPVMDPLMCGIPPLDGDQSITRIPLRIIPGAPLPFGPEDIVLNSGDIVYVPGRDPELFSTGGLLPAGQYPLPRDEDLHVVEAISAIGGPLVNGAFGGNNLSGVILQPGIGFPSPSLLAINRNLPDGSQVTIRVDLNRALSDPRENILVQPGDVLVLQETHGEAVGRYFTNVFAFDFFSVLFRGARTTGSAGFTVP